jgi:adenylate cyclase
VIGEPVNEAARLADHAKGLSARVVSSRRAVAAASTYEQRQWTAQRAVALRGRPAPTPTAVPIRAGSDRVES